MQQWIMGADDQGPIDETVSSPAMFLKGDPAWTGEVVSTVAASATATGEIVNAAPKLKYPDTFYLNQPRPLFSRVLPAPQKKSGHF